MDLTMDLCVVLSFSDSPRHVYIEERKVNYNIETSITNGIV